MNATNLGPVTANIFSGLAPNIKTSQPTPTKRRKRFSKIREKLTGKR